MMIAWVSAILKFSFLILAPTLLIGQIIDRNVNDFIPQIYSGPTCPYNCSCIREVVRCASRRIHTLPDALDLGPFTTSLDARNNQISDVGPRTFQLLANLTNMQLNDNLLTEIKSYTFMNMVKLKYLYLHMNKISTIRPHAFYGLRNLKLLYLNHNQIKTLDYRSFVGLVALKELSFQSNLIKTIGREILLQCPSLYLIKMRHNPIICDCKMQWLLDKLKEDMKNGFPFIADVLCFDPERLKDISLMTLRDDKLLKLDDCQNGPELQEKYREPYFMEQPNDLTVAIGDSVELMCGARGYPLPRIKWIKNNQSMTKLMVSEAKTGENPMEYNPDQRVMLKRKVTRDRNYMLNQVEIIAISPVLPEDQGSYQCEATNALGKLRSKRARVEVVSKEISKNHAAKHSSDLVEKSINEKAISPPRPSKIINCGNLNANPKFTRVRWSKGEQFLGEPGDEKYFVDRDNEGALVIRNFSPDSDEGIYTCHVEDYSKDSNFPDNYRYQAFVTEQISKDSEIRDEEAKLISMYNQSPPKQDIIPSPSLKPIDFTNLIENETSGLVVELGRPVILECQIFDQHRIKDINEVMWTKDDIDIPAIRAESASALISPDENYVIFQNASLKIIDFGIEDAGLYTCHIFVTSNESQVSYSSRSLALVPAKTRTSAAKGRDIHENEITNDILVKNEKLDLIRDASHRATNEIDHAILKSIVNLKKHGIQGNFKDMMAYLRYPTGDAFQLARAGDIFHRTFQIIEDYVEKQGKNLKNTQFDDHKGKPEILTASQVALIANMSGCRASQDLLTSSRDSNLNPCAANMCFHSKYRSIDGTCNNLFHPSYGSSLAPFHRLLPARYENGFSTPLGWNEGSHNINLSQILFGPQYSTSNTTATLPNPRLVSRSLAATDSISVNPAYTMMLMQWGQFLDHDLDFSVPALSYNSYVDVAPCGEHCFNSQPCYPIKPMDQDPRIASEKCIEFVRSSAVCGTGASSYLMDTLAPREQINSITAFIDASNVYGSSDIVARDLKEFVNDGATGRLKVGLSSPYINNNNNKRMKEPEIEEEARHKTFLPFNTGIGMDCKRGRGFAINTRVPCLLAGDHRANEQLGLLAMHTLWMREHNRLVKKLKYLNPGWGGETLYQEARKIVGAQMQVITYHEWLPKILGPVGMQNLESSSNFHPRGQHYAGYDSKLNPGIANVFATAVLRFGHSLVNPTLFRLNDSFEPLQEFGGHLPLHDAFFAPARLIEEGGIDPLLRGLFGSPSKAVNTRKLITSELTEKLFQHHHNPAFDLIAINLQRGRDHGLPSYAQWRQWCGMPLGAFDTSHYDHWANSSSLGLKLVHFVDVEAVRNLRGHRIKAFHQALGGPSVFSNVEAVSKLADLYYKPDDVEIWIGGMLENQVEGAILGPTFSCLLIDQFRRLRDGDRFWYQNFGHFTQSQLVQVEKASLSSVLCNNGDAITKIQPDAFLHVNSTYPYIDCSQINDLDLTPWADCHSSEKSTLLSLSKVESNTCDDGLSGQTCRRDNIFGLDNRDKIEKVKSTLSEKTPQSSMYFTAKNLNTQNVSPAKRHNNEDISNEMDAIRSQLIKLEAEMELLHNIVKNFGKVSFTSKSCVDSKGIERVEGERWDDGPCKSCECRLGQTKCYTITCPDLKECPTQYQFKTPDQCCLSCIR